MISIDSTHKLSEEELERAERILDKVFDDIFGNNDNKCETNREE